MTDVKPATDADLALCETSGYQHVSAAALIARIRQSEAIARELAEALTDILRRYEPGTRQREMDRVIKYEALLTKARAAGLMEDKDG